MNTNPIPELAPQLKQLRLSGILDSLESRNLQVIQGKLAYTEFLAMSSATRSPGASTRNGLDSRTAQRFTDAAQLKEQMEASKQRWIGAIQQDQLAWDGHVSDLKKWECAPAGEYGVRSIPQTLLVGRDGKIVAINPRTDLEQQVQKFL